MDTGPIEEFFDREACCVTPQAEGLSGVSHVLFKELEETGLRGRTLLELGCGLGTFVLEALGRGAVSVTGIDLSARAIETARRRAGEAGFGDRSRFEAGNAAEVRVEPHDVVVLDKAICCYPDSDRMIANTAPAAASVYAFSVPESRGLRGILARIALGFENGWRRLRRDPFRSFVHPVGRIHKNLREEGLEPERVGRFWMWHVAVFRRAA